MEIQGPIIDKYFGVDYPALVVSYNTKCVHEVLVNCVVKLAQENGVVI